MMSHTADPPSPHTLPDAHDTGFLAGREVFFTFEGRRLAALEGESIAKALFRNGIRVLSYSIKYGRPRGIHCGRGRCIMCHVEVDGVTGVKSCITPLAAGMRIRRQQYKPFYGSFLSWVMRRVPFPAGFYYRMFTRPRLIREAFIATIRRVAGAGRIDDGPQAPRDLSVPPAILSRVAGAYDVVVIGAGVSGMTAALAASEAGAGVLLVDEYGAPGGHAIGRMADSGLEAARDDLIRRTAAAGFESASGLTAQGYYEPGRVLIGRESKGSKGGAGMKAIAAGAFVFATGAQDLIPLFENNDLPGIFGARGLRLFVERDDLVPGRKAVVYADGPGVADTIAMLSSRGVEIEAVVSPGAGQPAGIPAGFRFVGGARPVRAEGREWIDRAVFKTGGGDRVTLPCDLLCVAGPGQPSFELAQHAGFRFELRTPGVPGDDASSKMMMPVSDLIDDDDGPRRHLVGEASGRFDWKTKIEHAAAAGTAAARKE